MTALVKRLVNSSFLRSLTLLTGGTILAQMIPFLALPFLSRLYTPETFALLSLMMMGAYFTASLSTLNLDQAIVVPRADDEARSLATLTLLSAGLFAVLYTIIIIIFFKPIADGLQISTDHSVWIFLVPLNLFLGSLASIGGYWLLRRGKSGWQASIKLAHALAAAILSIAFGWLGYTHGLLMAFCSAVSFSAFWALLLCWKNDLRLAALNTNRSLLTVLADYRRFPLWGALPTACNNLAIQIPLLATAMSFSHLQVGHFSITRNLLSGGLVLVAGCFSQLLLKHLSDRQHAHLPLWPFFWRVMALLLALGISGSAVLWWLGPTLFSLYLGPGWEDSGVILRSLVLSAPFVLMGASVLGAAVAIGHLKLLAVWQVLFLLASTLLFFQTSSSLAGFINIMVGIEAALYALLAILVGYIVWRHDQLKAGGPGRT